MTAPETTDEVTKLKLIRLIQLSAWNKGLKDIASLIEELRFVLRVANYTNQRDLARRLASALAAARRATVEVTLIGKSECGALELAERLEGSLPKVRATVLEALDYADFDADVVTRAKNTAAILFVVPTLAPFFDETAEFITREFSSLKNKVMLAAVAEEHAFSKELPPSLQDFSYYTQDELVPALLDLLARTQLPVLQTELRTHIRFACDQLLPIVGAFGEFLSMSQAQFLRQLDFIRRDVSALQVLAQNAHQALEAQSRKALSDLREVAQALAQTMRQHAITTVQNAPFPKEILGNQEMRTFIGRDIVAAARAAGYREFERRIQSIAMDLNSSSSVLLSNVDQLRTEAQARLDELTLNLGPGLLAEWIQGAAPGWSEKPLEFPLEAVAGFPDMVIAAARQIREAIVATEFSSGWASRIEGLYRAELTNASTAGWMPATLDERLAAAIAQIWTDKGERNCGLLVGRLNKIVQTVSSGLASSRMGALELPKDENIRSKIGDAYRGFAVELEKIQK